MKHFFLSLHKHHYCFVLLLTALFLLFTGCAGTGKPQYSVETYLMNYPAPSLQTRTPLAVSIKFNRFSIAAVYNTANMIFRNDAYSIDSFNYSRWAVNPADMIADDLLRDLRTGGLFQAVFSRHDAEEGRFVLSGGVEEFYLKTDDKTKTAVIGVVISIHDAREIRTSKKMLFQKKYKKEEALGESSPRGYARAASLAMQALSEQVSADIYQAIKTNMP